MEKELTYAQLIRRKQIVDRDIRETCNALGALDAKLKRMMTHRSTLMQKMRSHRDFKVYLQKLKN